VRGQKNRVQGIGFVGINRARVEPDAGKALVRNAQLRQQRGRLRRQVRALGVIVRPAEALLVASAQQDEGRGLGPQLCQVRRKVRGGDGQARAAAQIKQRAGPGEARDGQVGQGRAARQHMAGCVHVGAAVSRQPRLMRKEAVRLQTAHGRELQGRIAWEQGHARPQGPGQIHQGRGLAEGAKG